MFSGNDAIKQIEGSRSKLLSERNEIDTQLSKLQADEFANARSRGTLLLQLSKLRLDNLLSDDTYNALSYLKQDLAQQIQERARAISQLHDEINLIQEELSRLEGSLHTPRESMILLSSQLNSEEQKLAEALEFNADYSNKLAELESASLIAESAIEKAQSSGKEMAKKLKSYENDDLFMYLWNRGFGTSRYSANPLSKFLDRWVSKTINFEESRVNYWTLKELPKRLHAHSRMQSDRLEAIELDLDKIEHRFLDDHGFNQLLEKQKSQQDQIDQLELKIQNKESELAGLMEKDRLYLMGEDSEYKACVGVIHNALERQSVQNLLSHALRTKDSRDDNIVEQLRELEAEFALIKSALEGCRARRNESDSRLKEFDEMRRKYRSERLPYRDVHYKNEGLVKSALSGLLEGAIKGAVAWGAMEANRRATKRFPRSGQIGGAIIRDRLQKHRNSWNRPASKSGGFRTGGGF